MTKYGSMFEYDPNNYFTITCNKCGSTNVKADAMPEGYEIACNNCGLTVGYDEPRSYIETQEIK